MTTNKVLLLIFIFLFVSGLLYYQYIRYTFIDRMVKSNTHIESYKLILKVQDNQQWYANILISKSDGEKLFKLYPFQYGSNPIYLAGKYHNPYIKNNPGHWYYFNDKDQGLMDIFYIV